MGRAGALCLLALVMLVGVIDGTPCETGNDCGQDECCIHPGTCHPMGDIMNRCDPRQGYAWSKPVEMVTECDVCPCKPGLICGPVADDRGYCSIGK